MPCLEWLFIELNVNAAKNRIVLFLECSRILSIQKRIPSRGTDSISRVLKRFVAL